MYNTDQLHHLRDYNLDNNRADRDNVPNVDYVLPDQPVLTVNHPVEEVRPTVMVADHPEVEQHQLPLVVVVLVHINPRVVADDPVDSRDIFCRPSGVVVAVHFDKLWLGNMVDRQVVNSTWVHRDMVSNNSPDML